MIAGPIASATSPEGAIAEIARPNDEAVLPSRASKPTNCERSQCIPVIQCNTSPKDAATRESKGNSANDFASRYSRAVYCCSWRSRPMTPRSRLNNCNVLITDSIATLMTPCAIIFTRSDILFGLMFVPCHPYTLPTTEASSADVPTRTRFVALSRQLCRRARPNNRLSRRRDRRTERRDRSGRRINNGGKRPNLSRTLVNPGSVVTPGLYASLPMDCLLVAGVMFEMRCFDSINASGLLTSSDTKSIRCSAGLVFSGHG
mmetsp:Transcript_7840/g.12987  ORF Transcript_7840/g.12987 Transcript_7840/m.12987 type:complete len:260 (+) Transcript_7840:1031-1810(+)